MMISEGIQHPFISPWRFCTEQWDAMTPEEEAGVLIRIGCVIAKALLCVAIAVTWPLALIGMALSSEEQDEIYDNEEVMMSSATAVVEVGKLPTAEEVTTLVSVETIAIRDAYAQFEKEGHNDRTLVAATDALSRLKQAERVLWRAKEVDRALELKEMIKPYDKKVQAMNFVSPVLTCQDMSNVASFYAKPIETVFLGEKDGVRYVQPDSSSPAIYGIQILFKTGAYKSTGIGRWRFGPHPDTKVDQYYDSFYLVKHDDRKTRDAKAFAEAEGLPYEGSFSFRNLFTLQSTLDAADKALREARRECIRYFSRNCTAWGYESCRFLSTAELYDEAPDGEKSVEIAASCDVVRCYYKKEVVNDKSSE